MAPVFGIGTLPANNIIQYPSGRWGFVGSVDIRLAYTELDGSDLSDERARELVQFGPGLLRPRVKACAWPTRDAPIAAAQELGETVTGA